MERHSFICCLTFLSREISKCNKNKAVLICVLRLEEGPAPSSTPFDDLTYWKPWIRTGDKIHSRSLVVDEIRQVHIKSETWYAAQQKDQLSFHSKHIHRDLACYMIVSNSIGIEIPSLGLSTVPSLVNSAMIFCIQLNRIISILGSPVH